MELSNTIDWISCTNPYPNGFNVLPPALMDAVYVERGGRNNYSESRKYVLGMETFRNPSRPTMGIHTVYNGSSLTRIEQETGLTGSDIVHHHLMLAGKFSRLDVAIDIFDTEVDIYSLYEQACKGEYKTKIRTQPQYNERGLEPESLYIGSQKTRQNMIRIYNKQKQLNLDDYRLWTRVELERRGVGATNTARELRKAGYTYESFAAAINGTANFINDPLWKKVMGATNITVSSRFQSGGGTRQWLLESVAGALAREILQDMGFAKDFETAVKSKAFEYLSDMKGNE